MKAVLILCAVLFTASFAEAVTVNLRWNPGTESDLVGYRLYRATGSCDAPGAFVTVQVFPVVTNGVDTVSSDGLYCYKLTAFDTGGNESLFSNTAQADVNVNPPMEPTGLNVQSVLP